MGIPEAPPPGLLAKASVKLGSCVGCTQTEVSTKGPLEHHIEFMGSMQHVIVAGARLIALALQQGPYVMLCVNLQVSANVLGLVMTDGGRGSY